MAIIDTNFTFLWQIANIVILLVVFTGICFLQAYLSKRENKWLGLILPILKISISLIFLAIAYLNIASKLEDPSSFYIPYRTTILMGLVFNIPTIIYFIIYFVCREKLKNKSAVDKMKIKDL